MGTYFLFGLNAAYSIQHVPGVKSLQIWGQVNNLLDRDPPFVNSNDDCCVVLRPAGPCVSRGRAHELLGKLQSLGRLRERPLAFTRGRTSSRVRPFRAEPRSRTGQQSLRVEAHSHWSESCGGAEVETAPVRWLKSTEQHARIVFAVEQVRYAAEQADVRAVIVVVDTEKSATVLVRDPGRCVGAGQWLVTVLHVLRTCSTTPR
ncbi:MAG: hypothetical protein WDO12_06465 [Pseudomonadota bacterium]